jgi:guanylate kinase
MDIMIILTGPSASGKTEIAKILFQKYGIRKVITHTTRPIRPTEIKDVDYYFVDEPSFLSLKKSQAFAETTLYNRNHYGTSFKELGDDKVLIVDPNGLKAFVALNNPRFITFYIDANETTRINRMLMRGQDLDFAKQRIAFDRLSFADNQVPGCRFRINNETVTIEEAADQIIDLYKKSLNE